MPLKFHWESDFKETELGPLPVGWEVKNLYSLADAIKGLSYNSSEITFNDGKFLFITLNNFKRGGGFKKHYSKFYNGNKYNDSQKVVNGDLLIALTDMTQEAKVVGAPAIVSLPAYLQFGIISLDCAKLKPKTKFDAKFLEGYLSVTQEENSMFANGVNVLHLDIDQFMLNKYIPYPPYWEQIAIGRILSWFDDLIENKKRQNEILEKTAMAIFKSWFVDFEPFKDGEFVDSELGKIPKGWEVKKLGEVAKVETGGGAPQDKKYFANGCFPFIRVKHLTSGVCVTGFDLINALAVKDLNLRLYSKGSVVFQRSGESLKAARVNLLPFDAYVVNHLAVIEKKLNKNIIFLYCLLKFYMSEMVESIYAGTSLPYLRTHDIENFAVIIPAPSIFQSFNLLVEPIFQKIILNQREITALRKIHDTLLPLLVFGRLRVGINE